MQDASKMADEIFESGCGEGLGVNQFDAARNFVAEELKVVPVPRAGPAFSPEVAAQGWLASGSAAFVCDKGTVSVRVNTRSGRFADRAEVKCEMRFMPVDSDPWNIRRTTTGIAVSRPREARNRSVRWDFTYDDGFTRPLADEYPTVRPERDNDKAAVAFVTSLGWD